jgi:hypothetical protein
MPHEPMTDFTSRSSASYVSLSKLAVKVTVVLKDNTSVLRSVLVLTIAKNAMRGGSSVQSSGHEVVVVVPDGDIKHDKAEVRLRSAATRTRFSIATQQNAHKLRARARTGRENLTDIKTRWSSYTNAFAIHPDPGNPKTKLPLLG